MIAIHTKYIGPTSTRGSRIKAYTSKMGLKGFEVTIPYPHEFDGVVECHFEAVKALIIKNKLDWNPENMRYGDSADGRGYSFCFDASSVEKMI